MNLNSREIGIRTGEDEVEEEGGQVSGFPFQLSYRRSFFCQLTMGSFPFKSRNPETAAQAASYSAATDAPPLTGILRPHHLKSYVLFQLSLNDFKFNNKQVVDCLVKIKKARVSPDYFSGDWFRFNHIDIATLPHEKNFTFCQQAPQLTSDAEGLRKFLDKLDYKSILGTDHVSVGLLSSSEFILGETKNYQDLLGWGGCAPPDPPAALEPDAKGGSGGVELDTYFHELADLCFIQAERLSRTNKHTKEICSLLRRGLLIHKILIRRGISFPTDSLLGLRPDIMDLTLQVMTFMGRVYFKKRLLLVEMNQLPDFPFQASHLEQAKLLTLHFHDLRSVLKEQQDETAERVEQIRALLNKPLSWEHLFNVTIRE